MTRPLSRRSLLGAALGTVSAAALAGCSGGRPTDGATTVQFLGPEAAETFAPVIRGFELARPGLRIAYTPVPPDQLNDSLQLRLSAKDNAIDVYCVDQPRVPALTARGFLTDLTDIADRARPLVTPEQYDVSSWEGRLRSLPVWTSTQYLFYNADLLDKAGIARPGSAPKDRWSWEQTKAAGRRAMTRAGADYALLLEQTDLYYGLQPLVESLHGGSGITGGDMLTPAVTTQGWIDALTWYRTLFADGSSPRGMPSTQLSSLFTSGRVPFFVGGPWNLGAFASLKDFTWGTAPQPMFAHGRAVTPTDSWSWGVSPYAQHPDAARQFIEYAALTTEGSLATVAASPLIPSNRAAFGRYAAQLADDSTRSTEGVAEIMRYELAHTAVSRPRSIGYTQFESVMGSAFSDIRNGSDVEPRLAKASGELVRTWERLR
ncbi:extracellular solute-binding protein [Streptomyces sp. NBC_01267]|uniref:sugar ABC transporter substrate-binding protein n=1 Tax=unclassified Streptomyces TaxID=2593676 RepID=UPI002DDBB404|nr:MULTISPECIES: extracellular solute-binding protein [unclassified Streptomyces]WSC18222.1 extracellular solute-binding protein [Streptomyces sp. NBC_01766]WSV52267.1 extracellular solute-binding protein [Streptomyces sp. NBC_01014]